MRSISITAAKLMAALVVVCLLITPPQLQAHCDSLDGPVVKDARRALENGDVARVLKWVNRENEQEVRAAFNKTLVVRSKGAEARELADVYFFETVVRLHRAGEGEPFTGLKPAGLALGPAIVGGDKAIETGSVDELVKLVVEAASAGMRERFTRVLEKKKHADDGIDAGREYVEAYVEFMHYVERLHEDSAYHGSGRAEQPKPAAGHKH